MKILHVFPFFSVKHAGGTCDLMYKIARAQEQNGHEVTIYTSNYKFDFEYAASLKGVTVKAFPSFLNALRLYIMPGMITESKRELMNFDVIHLHAFRIFQNIIIRHYAIKYNVPYVMDSHGSAPFHQRRRKFKQLFDILIGCRILKDASTCIAETNLGIDEYRELGIPDAQISLIPPPFPVEEFAVLPEKGLFRKKYGLDNRRIIMFFGRIHYIKGIDFLVEAFYELTKIRDDAMLVIVGSDDGHQEELEKMIDNFNMKDKVLFTGFTQGNDKLSALVDADMVIQTSRYEQGAWAPIEAVLCNTPIIVSDNSGAGEDVTRMDAGYLVEWGNKTDLRDKMQKILDDPDEIREKTQKAKKYVESNLCMSNKVLEYEELYTKCIDSV